tara:strand:- start:545 stop:1132 length:588 start_codon:yes stop_codon:yes gene_type:complete
MKKILLIFLLFLSLQSWTKADDIKSITIEGISIGDSALDYFTEQEIKQNIQDHYKNKSFIPVQMNEYSFFKTYDAVDFDYKSGDKNYIIQGLYGVLFIDDINKCETQLDNIVNDISPILTNAHDIQKSKIIHDSDPSGKSYIIEKQWVFQNGDRILVQCYNMNKELGYEPISLTVSIRTKEYHNFLRKIAYKTIT